jgi:hypoxanthine phosphoribosyltransferase
MGAYPRCELVSWHQVHTLSRILARRIRHSGFLPDMILAIGRGGYVPGRILADLLGLMELAGIRVEHYHGARKAPQTLIRQPLCVDIEGRRILLVDDVSDTGDTFEVAFAHLRERGNPLDLRTATLHHKLVSRVRPDYFARSIRKWRWLIYPWAVTEDLTAFARDMRPQPGSAQELGQRLWEERGIKAGPEILHDVLALLASTG